MVVVELRTGSGGVSSRALTPGGIGEVSGAPQTVADGHGADAELLGGALVATGLAVGVDDVIDADGGAWSGAGWSAEGPDVAADGGRVDAGGGRDRADCGASGEGGAPGGDGGLGDWWPASGRHQSCEAGSATSTVPGRAVTSTLP